MSNLKNQEKVNSGYHKKLKIMFETIFSKHTNHDYH